MGPSYIQTSFGRLPTRLCLFNFMHKSLVVSLLVWLSFVDALSVCFVGYYLYMLDAMLFLAWFLVIPFAQPLAIISGAAFFATEFPRVGRFYAEMTLLSL